MRAAKLRTVRLFLPEQASPEERRRNERKEKSNRMGKFKRHQ